jgi:hypothetical protein
MALNRPDRTVARGPRTRSPARIESPPDISPNLKLCRCGSAVVDGETCILCGRYVAPPLREDPLAVDAAPPQWTPAGIVRAMRAFAFFHDRPPSEAEWSATASAWPTSHAVQRHFGSFDNGLSAAGVI